MEATSSRNELVRILSDVYRASSEDELGPITYLIQGRLAPFFEPVEIGLGPGLLITAIATAYPRLRGGPGCCSQRRLKAGGGLPIGCAGTGPECAPTPP